MAADFQLVLGANYSQLERDLKVATDIALKWSDNARQQAIFNIQTKVNKQSLNASLAEMNKAIEKATSKVADENRIFNLFTTNKKLFSRQVDFREGIESTDQLIQRINELRNLLRGMDTGRIKVISGENAEEARQLSDQIDALQKRISVLKNGSSKKGIKEFENMSIKLNEAKKEANNLKVALDSLKNSGRHGKAFDREVRNLEDALQRANNKVKEFQANVRMLGKNNKTISDFDSLNKQLYEAELRMEALLEKSQKDTNAKENIQALIEVYRELFRIISQGERDMLRGINQIDKEEQKAARKAEQETSKLTKKQKAALEEILKKKEQISNLRSNLTSKDDLDSLRVNRDIIQQIYNIQKSLIGKKNSGIDNATLAKTKSELDEIISKINIAQKQLKAANKDLHTHSGIFKDLMNYAKMYLSVWQFFRVNRQIVETTGFFEQQAQALRSIIQDAPKANALFNQLKQYSLQSPLTFQELVENTKKLTAYQIPTEDLFETTKRLADLSSGLGVEMNRIILAYGQIRAASVLRGQEVRQLTEAGIPIINELANAFSNLEGRAVSTAEVFKKISERGVSFEMIKDILWNMTSEGGKFYNMQEKLMNTDIYGPMQKMKDQWKLSLNDMGTSMKGLYAFILKGITAIEKSWRVALGGLIGFAISKIVNPAFTMTQRIVSMQLKAASKVKLAWRLVASSIKGFFKANLFSIVTTGISLIIGKIVQLNAETRRLKNEIADIEKDYANKASELADNFILLVNALRETNKESKEEENIMNKLKSAYSDILPLSELNADKLRNETTAYKDLTTAIIASVDAELQREKILKKRQLLNSNIDKIASSEKSKNDAIKASPTVFDNMVNMIKKNIYTKTEEEMKNIVKTYLVAYKSYNDLPTGNYAVLNRVIEKSYKEFDKYSQNVEYTGILDRRAELASYMGENAASYLEDNKSILDELIKIEDELSSIKNPEKQDIVKSYIDKIIRFGLTIPENTIVSDLASGEANNKDIQDFFNLVKTKNAGSNNLAGKSFLDNIIKKVVNEFVWLGDNEEKINKIIDDSQITDLYDLKWKQDTKLDEYQNLLQKTYDEANSIYEKQVDKNTDYAKTQLKIINKVKEIDGLVNYDVESNSKKGKKDASQSTQNNIVRLKKEFDNLKNAYTSEQNMMKYVTESSAITTLRGLDKPGLNEYFTKTLDNGSIDWVSQFKEIYKKLSDIDTDAAISMQEEWNKFIAKDVVADKLRELKNGIEDIDRSFEKSKNAKEYFQALLDAGMSWEDAVLAATKISGTFDIAQKGSTLIHEQIGKLMSGIGINYDLTGDDGISAFEQELRKVTEMQIGENESVFGDSIPKEKAEEILKLLSQLREIQKNELVELVKINTDNYDIKGVSSERARLYSSFLESLESGSSAMILDSYGKLSANNARLFNPFNTGNDASFALSNLYELINKGENVQENTSAFNKIAETLPGGNRVKEALATNDEKIIEDAIKKATSKLKLQEIAGKMDDMLSVFNSAVGLVDSFTLLTGGQVNENDQFHTAMSSFTNIMSSGSSAVKKALTGDFLGAIADGAKAMSELVLFGAKIHDAGLQQEIDKLTDHIEKLDTAISNLERTASLSYGEEKWLYESNALRKMYVQLEDARKASELENSKKIVDKDKRAELEQNVTDMELSIEEKWKEITDDIFGSVDDIASRLGNALRDAFENGKNAARAWKDAVNEYVKDIFYNLMIESVMKDKVDEIVQGWKAKSQTDTDTKNEEKRAELIQEEYQKYLDKVDKYSKEHEGNNQMIHGYAMEQYKEYQDKVDEINATSYYSEKDAFKDWVLKNTDKMAEDLNDIYNDPELQAYYKVWKSLHGSTTSSAYSNSLQSMTEDAANRLQALWNTCLVEFIKGNGMLTNVESNTAGILNQIQITNQLIGSMSSLMNKNQTDILGALSSSASGAKPLYVKMS